MLRGIPLQLLQTRAGLMDLVRLPMKEVAHSLYSDAMRVQLRYQLWIGAPVLIRVRADAHYHFMFQTRACSIAVSTT